MSAQMPDKNPRGARKGLSGGALAALIVLGVILLLFGICVAALNAG